MNRELGLLYVSPELSQPLSAKHRTPGKAGHYLVMLTDMEKLNMQSPKSASRIHTIQITYTIILSKTLLLAGGLQELFFLCVAS